VSANAIVQAITAAPRIKSGTLRFWGDWFGKPYDNIHQIVGCTIEDHAAVIRFDRGERLRVWEPRDFKINGDEFYIADAATVRWEWPNYGRAPAVQKLYFMEYVRSSEGISASTDVDWYTHEFHTSPSAMAVEML
jgi:hypothetical protein